jgi:hypothetical protein
VTAAGQVILVAVLEIRTRRRTRTTGSADARAYYAVPRRAQALFAGGYVTLIAVLAAEMEATQGRVVNAQLLG